MTRLRFLAASPLFRQLRQDGMWDSQRSPWSDSGSERYIWTEAGLERAIDYVLNRQDG